MASSFSTSGEDALTKTVAVRPEDTPVPGSDEFEEYYELERTAREIEEGDYHRVCDRRYLIDSRILNDVFIDSPAVFRRAVT